MCCSRGVLGFGFSSEKRGKDYFGAYETSGSFRPWAQGTPGTGKGREPVVGGGMLVSDAALWLEKGGMDN